MRRRLFSHYWISLQLHTALKFFAQVALLLVSDILHIHRIYCTIHFAVNYKIGASLLCCKVLHASSGSSSHSSCLRLFEGVYQYFNDTRPVAKLTASFPAIGATTLWPVPIYTVWWHRHWAQVYEHFAQSRWVKRNSSELEFLDCAPLTWQPPTELEQTSQKWTRLVCGCCVI